MYSLLCLHNAIGNRGKALLGKASHSNSLNQATSFNATGSTQSACCPCNIFLTSVCVPKASNVMQRIRCPHSFMKIPTVCSMDHWPAAAAPDPPQLCMVGIEATDRADLAAEHGSQTMYSYIRPAFGTSRAFKDGSLRSKKQVAALPGAQAPPTSPLAPLIKVICDRVAVRYVPSKANIKRPKHIQKRQRKKQKTFQKCMCGLQNDKIVCKDAHKEICKILI